MSSIRNGSPELPPSFGHERWSLATDGSRQRVIGILGGMGPAATVDLFSRIVSHTPATRDQDHPPVVVWSDPRVPDRTEFLLQPDGVSPVSAMKRGIIRLEVLGANLIAVACNTAHHWYADLCAASTVPVLHIADCVVAALRSTMPAGGAVGLMCTEGTLTSGFYQEKLSGAGYSVVVPPADVQRDHVTACIRAVKAGDLDRGRALGLTAANRILSDGAQILILACTEFPLVLRGAFDEARIIDTTDVLARTCVEIATRPFEGMSPPADRSTARQTHCVF